jgi:hypothetical protein
MPAVVIPPIPKLQLVPPNPFNPATLGGDDLELYFHDLTVEPGKTYRYKVIYTLYNPVFNQPTRVAKDQAKLADIYGIDSPASGWSEAITVDARTRFWLAAKQPGRATQDQVSFTVFTWHGGNWQEKDYNAVAAGDEIGADEGDSGDFSTHWTLLDLKAASGDDPQTRDVLVVPDDGGQTRERDSQSDTSSQEFKRFVTDFNAQGAKP